LNRTRIVRATVRRRTRRDAPARALALPRRVLACVDRPLRAVTGTRRRALAVVPRRRETARARLRLPVVRLLVRLALLLPLDLIAIVYSLLAGWVTFCFRDQCPAVAQASNIKSM
jgi:hypothetical protein